MDVLCWVPFITGSLVQSLSHTLAPIEAAFWQQYRKHIAKEMTGLTAFMYCQNTVSFTCKITPKLVCTTYRIRSTDRKKESFNRETAEFKTAQNLTDRRGSPCQGVTSWTSQKLIWNILFLHFDELYCISFVGFYFFKTARQGWEEVDQIAAKDG